MAFAEVEDRIERLELVLFPETWKRFGTIVEKGSLLLIGAKLQHQDEEEGIKLLAERIEPLTPEFRPERYKNWLGGRAGEKRQERASGQSGARSGPRSAAAPQGAVQERSPVYSRGAGRSAPPNEAPGAGGTPPLRQVQESRGASASLAAPAGEADAPELARSRSTTPSKTQRLFIKISGDKEKAGLLPQLEALLKSAKGPLETVLFYEREQRLLALSDQYRIKPSPELIASIDQLLGEGSAKVK